MSHAAAVADDPTPEPSSTVTRLGMPVTMGGDPPYPLAQPAYFADPTPETLAVEAAIGAAYEEGRALYGDDDGDAWLAALEDGTHPLCRVKTAVSLPA